MSCPECMKWYDSNMALKNQLKEEQHSHNLTLAGFYDPAQFGEMKARAEAAESLVNKFQSVFDRAWEVGIPLPEEIESLLTAAKDRDSALARAEAAEARCERLVEALEDISNIENKTNGGDWDEIDEARSTARKALAQAAEKGSAGEVER